MRYKMFALGVFMFLLCGLTTSHFAARPSRSPAEINQVKASDIEFTSAEELKAKVNKNQPVTVIDVRASQSFADSERKIKGAIHMKLRRLRYRLTFAPLKSVPRDSEVVIYCACPNDELSIQAAQILMDSGFKRVRALKGGWRAWLKIQGPVEALSQGI